MQILEKPYVRLNVYDYVESFCGWQPITELLKYAGSNRNEGYLLSLIKTGGRATEALSLDTENFTVDKRRKLIVVRNMKLLKHFKKIGKDAETGKWITEKIEAVRKPFPIPLKEPLSLELIEFLKATPDGLLFPSPYKGSKNPLTRFWAYKLLRKITDELPRPLFRNLGLDVPFKDSKGKVISDTIHLWNHWFRSQRASQLAAEYDFKEADLMEWFGWLDYKTALHYSHLGYSKLAEKMIANNL
jgi:hypothetical protein